MASPVCTVVYWTELIETVHLIKERLLQEEGSMHKKSDKLVVMCGSEEPVSLHRHQSEVNGNVADWETAHKAIFDICCDSANIADRPKFEYLKTNMFRDRKPV